jgi:hypothetical protein
VCCANSQRPEFCFSNTSVEGSHVFGMSYPTRIVTTNNLSRTLLNLPIRLLHPPSHPNHVLALYCSLLSLRQCIHLNTDLDKNNNAHGDALGPVMLCRAWTTLAEIGLLILRAGFGGDAAPNWCRGIEGEVSCSTYMRGIQELSISHNI